MDWVTHENFFTANTRGKEVKGLLRGYRVYPEPWEAAVGQELVNENLGTSQTGTPAYAMAVKNETISYRTLTAARKVSHVC